MNAHMDKPGIRFNDCVFSEPVPFAQWTPPRCAGLYVVLVQDPNWAPRPFQPLYFGEFGHNASLPAFRAEQANLAGVAPHEALFAAAFPMPFSTTAQRWLLRNELIRAYNPPCCVPRADTPPTELVQKLDELERRHQQETAELRWLFAGAANPEGQPPRRRIGFVPLSEAAE
jgi:hypothetical protein